MEELPMSELDLREIEDSLQGQNKQESQALLLGKSGIRSRVRFKDSSQGNNFPQNLGFEIEEFGRNFFRVNGCPHWLNPEKGNFYA